MPNSSLFQSSIWMAGILLGSVAMAQPVVPTGQPPKPPVSISPAMPAVGAPADPAKMAEPSTKPPAGVAVDANTFVLGVEDQISVSMWDDPRFDGTYSIRPDGKFSMKLIGEIMAAGLTPKQLQDAIDKAALTAMRNPISTVNVLAVHSKRVYFDGEGIKQPGPMDLVIPIHLMDAISTRGGFSEFANRKKISILRGGKPMEIMVGGKKYTNINYNDILSGKHPEFNPLLVDGDHIRIP